MTTLVIERLMGWTNQGLNRSWDIGAIADRFGRQHVCIWLRQHFRAIRRKIAVEEVMRAKFDVLDELAKEAIHAMEQEVEAHGDGPVGRLL